MRALILALFLIPLLAFSAGQGCLVVSGTCTLESTGICKVANGSTCQTTIALTPGCQRFTNGTGAARPVFFGNQTDWTNSINNSGMTTAACPTCTEGATRAVGSSTRITIPASDDYCDDDTGTSDIWWRPIEKCVGGVWTSVTGRAWSRSNNICSYHTQGVPPSSAPWHIREGTTADPCPSNVPASWVTASCSSPAQIWDWCTFRCGGNTSEGGCFVAGTQITMSNGDLKNIEDVEVGDTVLDSNGKAQKVVSLKQYEHHGRKYSINGGEYFFTANHPFKTTDGWKSLDPKQSMKETGGDFVSLMKVGDILLKSNGDIEVILDIDSIQTSEPVYNFEVTGGHEYNANDYWVHNAMK